MDIEIEWHWTNCFFLALACLVVPLDWFISAVMAACFHELCHILAVLCLKGRLYGIRIGNFGTILDAAPMEPVSELICILAGPAGSLLLWTLSQWSPKLALCGLIQGMFNLLPVYPLDGGRALFCLMELLWTRDMAVRLCDGVRHLFLIAIFVVGVVGIFACDLGMFPVFVTTIFGFRTAFGKIPCNAGKLGVQYSYHL